MGFPQASLSVTGVKFDVQIRLVCEINLRVIFSFLKCQSINLLRGLAQEANEEWFYYSV